MNTTLHYFYDPLCGWCYAAAPLIQAARAIPNLNIQLHAGGLWVDTQVKPITPELRAYVLANDARIAQISGQTFGEAYQNGLLQRTDVVLNSEPPIRAIRVAQALSAQGLAMLQRIQIAHFIEGRAVGQSATLLEIASELGLNHNAFADAYTNAHAQTQAHLHDTRELMHAWRINGYPNLILQRDEQYLNVPHTTFYDQPSAFAHALEAAIHAD